MARGRLISRTLGSSRKFAALQQHAGKLGEFAQSLYPLLVANSDDYGRLAGDAFTVKHAVFPTSARREEEFDKALDAMHLARIVRRFDAEGEQVLQIEDFDAHQPGLHKRTGSKFPEPSGNFPEIPSQSNRTESIGIERNSTALTRSVTPDGFEDFWSLYPKKKSRADAEKAWRKVAPSPELFQRIMAAVMAQRGSSDWIRESGRFVPYAATWLNAHRWEDSAEEAAPHVSRQTHALTQASQEFLRS
jgi:hypothetical protein